VRFLFLFRPMCFVYVLYSIEQWTQSERTWSVYFILRPHRIHDMRTLEIDDPVPCMVNLYVRHGRDVHKWLNGSTSCLGWKLLGLEKLCIRWVSPSTTSRERKFHAAFARLLWPLFFTDSTFVQQQYWVLIRVTVCPLSVRQHFYVYKQLGWPRGPAAAMVRCRVSPPSECSLKSTTSLSSSSRCHYYHHRYRHLCAPWAWEWRSEAESATLFFAGHTILKECFQVYGMWRSTYRWLATDNKSRPPQALYSLPLLSSAVICNYYYTTQVA